LTAPQVAHTVDPMSRTVAWVISVVVAGVVLGLLLWLQQDDDAIDLTPLPAEARSVRAADDAAPDSAPEPGGSHAVRAAGASTDAESGSVAPDQSDWPDHVEALIYDYLARHSSEIASINVVKCDDTTCTVSFYASDASEATQARLARIPTEFTRAPINAGSIGYSVRVTSPGLLEVQIMLYGRSVRFTL
jgi:hypothetical protein